MSGRWGAAAAPSLLRVLLALQCGVVFLQCSSAAASAMSADGECCFLLLLHGGILCSNFLPAASVCAPKLQLLSFFFPLLPPLDFRLPFQISRPPDLLFSADMHPLLAKKKKATALLPAAVNSSSLI
jgi:hypothetical protein